MISYSLMVSTAFALISVSMNTVYSVIIGPRNQVNLNYLFQLSIIILLGWWVMQSFRFRVRCRVFSYSSEVAQDWLDLFLFRMFPSFESYRIWTTSRSLFVHSGIGIPWIIEMVMAAFGALLWVVFYRRLVPLKMEESLTAGDQYRNKHGMVYKF